MLKIKALTKFSLLLFASLVTSILPATLVEKFKGDFKEKKKKICLSFQRDSSMSILLLV